MHLSCPHCHNPIEIVAEEKVEEIVCPSCGSSIQLDPGRTKTFLPDRAPRRLGKFEFLEALGGGGYGTVYKARDTELDRTVAIKIPRSGNLATPEDVDRFLREARAAAQLEHPGIVSIHDAGQSDGTCYLVSEYVPGATLADRLATVRLSFREAAELMVHVASALDYAHGQGVIHRDLKPSNIMLDLEGRPHVMDFGLAKREAGEVTVTLDGQVLGTPAYMSPEQARGEAHDVDARSDVYSLGVILYELLTGELPFRGNKRMLIVQVLQDDPRPPRRLNDHIPRDLETITLKCMSKEPGRRYETAGDLAADLRRWLAAEPIQARPVGRTERLWRWAKRNPTTASLSATILLLLLAVAIGSTVAAFVIAQKERAAVSAKELAERNEQETRKQRDQAAKNFELARQAVEKYFTKVSESRELRNVGLEQLRKDLLNSAVEFYQDFVQQRSDDRDIRAEQGKAFLRLAAMTEEIASQPEALAQYQKAVTIYDQLAKDVPTEPAYRAELATGLSDIGMAQRSLGKLDQAEAYLEKALEIREKLVADSPESGPLLNDLAGCGNSLGLIYRERGKLKESESAFKRSVDIREKLVQDDPDFERYRSDLAKVYNNLGNLYRATGRSPLAEGLFEKSLKITKQLVESEPNDSDYQSELSSDYNNLANLYRATGRVEQAESSHQKALAIREQLARDHPAVTAYQLDVALSHYNLGNLYRATGRAEQAEAAYLKSLEIRDRVAREHPNVSEFQSALAATHNSMGILYRNTGRPAQSETAYLEALKIRKRLVEQQPNAHEYAQELAASYNNLGNLYSSTDRNPEAEQTYQEALRIREQLAREHPTISNYQVDVAASYQNLALFYRDGDQPEQAERGYAKALELFQRLADAHPDVTEYQQGLAQCHSSLAVLYQTTKRPDEAVEAHQKALTIQEDLARKHPKVVAIAIDLADTYCMLGHFHRDTDKPLEALTWYDRSIAVIDPILQSQPRIVSARDTARRTYRGHAQVLSRLDRHAEAISSWDHAIEYDGSPSRDSSRLQRARSRAILGDHARATAEAAAIAEKESGNGTLLYDAACVFSLASAAANDETPSTPERKKLATGYAARAVELLVKARDAGFFRNTGVVGHLGKDKDLDALRGQADFRMLAEELEKQIKNRDE